MNIQQFQYVLAVAETKHFETAAQKCFITQSTLSTMISKFEDEIHIKIFDRKKKPVEVTTEGKILIEQLKTIIKDIHQLNELAKELKGEVTGNLSISVIPTIAPFLLPLFLKDFATQFPNLNIVVKEDTTGEIIRQIKSRELDIGIVSIPLNDTDIIETHLYDEPFVFYDSKNVLSKTTSVNNINMNNLCLLEEGHCMRTQIIKLCEIHKKAFSANLNFEYKAGSIDSLVRFVKAYNATTLLPYLAQIDFSKKEKNHISEFSPPIPYRSVGIITHRHFVKKKISNILQQAIQSKVNVLLPNEKMKGRKLNPL
jgi:LysR family hydrogen peroxide-inducible transcriptional activator